MQEIQNISFNTPIEQALGVDKNGMTTAKKLYEFLGMDRSHYSRWVKSNISGNQFAEENVDYWAFATDGERDFNPNPTQDYKLTARFAKKLSMMQKNERGEQAREYFTQLEERVKQKVIDLDQLSPETKLMNLLVQTISRNELETKRIAEEQKQIKETVEIQGKAIQTVKDTFAKGNSEQETVQWVTRCLNRIAESPNFIFEFGNRYAAAKNESYQRLTAKAGCRLDQKLRNAVERAKEKGYTKAQVDGITKLTIIMADKRLKEIYIGVIKEMMIAYCV